MTAISEINTITIDPADLPPRDGYRLFASTIVPRPIAWVSTMGTDGVLNLAPFSFFNAVAGNPPTVMVSIGQRKGQEKDTLRNIRETGEFVLNIADQALSTALNATSIEAPYELDEFDYAHLETAPSALVKPPRVAAAPIALEARLSQIVPITASAYTLVLGQVIQYHLRAGLLRENGLIDAERLDPLMRLGGNEFARLGAIYEMERP